MSAVPARLVAALAALLALSGCVSPAEVTVARPRLVVMLVIDGLPQRQVEENRAHLAPDGLRRFLDRGAAFTDAHYDHAYTVTAAGHAVIATGAHPHRHGIIGNDWRDATTGAPVYCVSDTQHAWLGHRSGKLDGTSPRNLKVETLGDTLRTREVGSRVVSVSAKDRSAIVMAGHKGTAYIYMRETGRFASTSYYMREHPAWVDGWNARNPADALFGREWTPLLAGAVALALPPEPARLDTGSVLPKRIGVEGEGPSQAFYLALLHTPYIDELTLDFARAAIAGEDLGRDDVPDILSVSLSGHDFVNHAWSAESRISREHLLRVDLALQGFFAHLDAVVGKDRYVVVLTSDHGFSRTPEVAAAHGWGGGRLPSRALLTGIEQALASRFGAGTWVLGFSADTVVLNRRLAAGKGVALADLAEVARQAALGFEGVAAAYTRAELESGSRTGAHFEAMRRSFHREISGDLQVALKPYWMFSAPTGAGATHGSPHPDDTHVPLLLYGPPWVKPARIDTRVSPADIAPTLASWLRIPPPAAAEGRPLRLP